MHVDTHNFEHGCAIYVSHMLLPRDRQPQSFKQVQYQQFVEQTKEMERQKREHKAQQKQSRKAPPPTPAPSQDTEEVEEFKRHHSFAFN